MVRRTNYFIKKKFQLRFLLGFVLLIVLAALLIMGLFLYVSNNTLTTGYTNSTLRVENTATFFFTTFLLIALISAVVVGVVGVIIFILFSHRIAGPLHHFETVLQEIEAGDLTSRIVLRKSDQLVELKTALNLLLESMNKRIGSIKKTTSDIDELLSKENDPELVPKLKARLEIIKKELKGFKIS
jgi:methyl-accepting chemotaxis protein